MSNVDNSKVNNKITVSLQNVSFAYGERPVLQGFSCHLLAPDLPGDIVALAGPSGLGKTTVLRLLAGLLQPQSGLVCCPADVSLLFQEDRLLPGLTAAAQVGAVLPAGADVGRWLALVELGAEADTLPGAMSGGMKRRLALARCLAYGQGAALLLLDEPFAGVDAACAGRIMQRVRGLGRPVIYTAHSAEVLALADRVLTL